MFTAAFWKGLAERSLKTFIQSTVAALLAAAAGSATAWEINWLDSGYDALGIGLLATFLSVATSLGNADFVAGAPAAVVVADYVDVSTPEDTTAGEIEDDDEELEDDDADEEPEGSEDQAFDPDQDVPLH